MAVFTDVFEDVTKYGKKLQTSEYKESGKYVIIDQGQKDIAGYTDETDGVFTDVPAIVFGDHTRVIKYVDKPCFLGADGVKLLKAKIENPNYKYLFYVLSNADIPNTGYNRHFKWLKEVEIPLPNVEEQNKIVETLEKVDELISCRKEQLLKLDELVKARFVEMFGDPKSNSFNWKREKLSSQMEVRGRVGWKGYKKEDLRDSGPLVLGATHLSDDGRIDLSEPVFLSEEKYFESPEIMVKQNDLIFAQRGSLGKVGLVETEYEAATINPCVLILRPIQINPQFARYFLMIQKDNGELDELNSGSTIPMITQKSIGEFGVIVPPMELQEQFAAFVEQTEKTKAEVQKSLDELETLKKSLMQKYFG